MILRMISTVAPFRGCSTRETGDPATLGGFAKTSRQERREREEVLIAFRASPSFFESFACHAVGLGVSECFLWFPPLSPRLGALRVLCESQFLIDAISAACVPLTGRFKIEILSMDEEIFSDPFDPDGRPLWGLCYPAIECGETRGKIGSAVGDKGI